MIKNEAPNVAQVAAAEAAADETGSKAVALAAFRKFALDWYVAVNVTDAQREAFLAGFDGERPVEVNGRFWNWADGVRAHAGDARAKFDGLY